MVMIDHSTHTDARQILEQIRARGERITTPRRAVIELLASTHEHLTVDDIANRLHPVHPSIAPSTVYRTLEALQEWGLVEKIHRGQGATFFHLAQTHQHLVCEVCGKPGSTENPLQNAHIIGFDVGVIDLGLSPDFLDSDQNIKTAHRSTCNKQTELDLQGSMDRLRELGEKELPQYLPAWIHEAWGREAEPRG